MAGGMSRVARQRVAGIDYKERLQGSSREAQGPDPRRVHRRDRPSPEARHSSAGTIRCDAGDHVPGVKGRRIYDEADSGGGDPGMGSIGPQLRKASEGGATPPDRVHGTTRTYWTWTPR